MRSKVFKGGLLLVMLTLAGAGTAAQNNAVDTTTSALAASQEKAVSEQGDQIPSLTETVIPSLTRIGISLVVIIAIIYLTVLLLRKLSGNGIGKKGTTVQIVEHTYLAPKKSVCLLKLADRAVLVGITDTTISLLTEMEWDSLPREVVNKADRTRRGFPGFLNDATSKLLRNRRGKGAEHEAV